MNYFEDTKIIRVTPGKLSKYIQVPVAAYSPVTHERTSVLNASDVVMARFKMYLHQIRLSKTCMNFIKTNLENQVQLGVRWTFFGMEDMITSPEKVQQNRLKFDFTMKYQVAVDQDFIKKVNDVPINFRLVAICSTVEHLLAQADIYLDDITKIANVKIQEKILFYSDTIDSSGESIAYLDVWYKLTCKQKALKAFLPVRSIEAKTKSMMKIGELLTHKFAPRSQDFSDVCVTDSEFDHFADSVWLVLNRNKVLKTTQSDINVELQERVKWLHFEANWKQTLQENSILHGKDPKDVKWRQWREEDTANVRLRTYDTITPRIYPPELSVTVVDLYFLEGCWVLKTDEIKKFYIEYSFLGFEGPKLETPISLPKLEAEEKIVFNFKRTFPIDINKHPNNCTKLCELIKNDDMIRFSVISEPDEDPDHPIQTCQELGIAEVPFNELIQLSDNEDTCEYEVVDVNNNIAVIGFLTVRVDGILAMRRMALDMMAPKGYKLYM